jgi:hypothetical protein
MGGKEVAASVLGIGDAIAHLMKNLHYVWSFGCGDLRKQTIQASEGSKKIRIVFKDDGSAGNVEVSYEIIPRLPRSPFRSPTNKFILPAFQYEPRHEN